MEKVRADYTFIDSMPSVVIDHVEGVRLADLMSASGIDMDRSRIFTSGRGTRPAIIIPRFPRQN